MIIMGLDIGYDRCGVCIMQDERIEYSCLITTEKKQHISSRLRTLRDDLVSLKQKYNPELVGIERLFFNRKNTTFEKICMSKGVAFEVFAECEITEIEPKRIKKEIIGNGNATKSEIQDILSRQLKINFDNYMDDVVDAVLIAQFLSQEAKFRSKVNSSRL